MCRGLLCSLLCHIISYSRSVYYFRPLYNRMLAQVQTFLLSCDHQWKSRLFKLASKCRVWLCLSSTISESNHSINVQTQANVKGVFYIPSPHPQNHVKRVLSLEYQSHKTFLLQTCCGSILNLIKIDWKLSEKLSTEVLIFQTTVTLNEGLDYPVWYLNVEFNGLLHYTNFERNWSVMSECKPTLKFFKQSHMRRFSLLDIDQMRYI